MIESAKARIRKVLSYFVPHRFGLGAGRGWLSSERKRILEQAFRYTRNEKVDGDYLEFGVARGRSLILAARASDKFASESGASCRLIGFDSFEGFPEPSGVDEVFERFQEGEEYHGGERVVHHHLSRNRIDQSRVELVNGWYEDTLNEETAEALALKDARVVNIDCDLYNSARQAIEFVKPFLQDGTVLLFDDWLCYLMTGSVIAQIRKKENNERPGSGLLRMNPSSLFPTGTTRMWAKHSS